MFKRIRHIVSEHIRLTTHRLMVVCWLLVSDIGGGSNNTLTTPSSYAMHFLP